MVISKRHSLMRKLPQCRRILFAHEIRPHPVPDDDHDMARLIQCLRCERNRAESAGEREHKW